VIISGVVQQELKEGQSIVQAVTFLKKTLKKVAISPNFLWLALYA
jgi:hypothetical protein